MLGRGRGIVRSRSGSYRSSSRLRSAFWSPSCRKTFRSGFDSCSAWRRRSAASSSVSSPRRGLTLRAPYKQRDEARAELTHRREIHDLLELDRHLRAIREANSRILGEVKEGGRTGPLGKDDDPWVRGENENLGLWLESNGFPDLVSELVVREPKLGTWEGVIETAREIDTKLTRVLEGDRLADVRLLRESVKAEAKVEPDLPSSRLSAVYEEGLALKEAAATPGPDDAVVDRLAARVTRSPRGHGRSKEPYRTSLPSSSPSGTRNVVRRRATLLAPTWMNVSTSWTE